MLDLVEKGKEGNRAIINYSNSGSYIKTRSNFYAKEIMETVPKYRNKNERQQAFKQFMHRLDIECFGIKHKKSKSSPRLMRKYKHKEVKELSELVIAHKKKHKTLQEELKAEKTVSAKIQRVGEVIIEPKHKPAERCAIFDPVTNELITDENEILSTTLKYNIGVLTKDKVAEQDLPEFEEQNKPHEWVINDTSKGRTTSCKKVQEVLKYLK